MSASDPGDEAGAVAIQGAAIGADEPVELVEFVGRDSRGRASCGRDGRVEFSGAQFVEVCGAVGHGLSTLREPTPARFPITSGRDHDHWLSENRQGEVGRRVDQYLLDKVR